MAVPLIVAGALAAGAAAGAGIGLASKAGQNQHRVDSFGESGQYDPNAFQYGGYQGGAYDYGTAMQQRAAGADSRYAPLAEYAGANVDRNNAMAARTGQGQVADMMMLRARGGVPSIAGQQSAQDIAMLQQNAARQMQQGQAAQAAQAASARGAAGVALAQQQAANNTANMQGAIGTSAAQSTQNISNQAQVNAANERLQAEQAAFGAYGGMRGQDLNSQQLSSQMAQFQAQQELQSRNVNDQRAMGYEQLGANANAQQLQAQTSGQQILANSFNTQEQLQSQQAQANANRRGALFDKLFPSDMRSKVPVDMGDATAQWERSFGPSSAAQQQVLAADNRAEAARIRAGFEQGGQGDSGGAMMLAPQGGGGNPMTGTLMQSAMGSMLSDENAKREAFLAGASFGMNPRGNINPATGKPSMPDYMQKPDPRLDPKGLRSGLEPLGRGWGGRGGSEKAAAARADIAEANRSMAGSAYAYKPGMTPPGQAPGEPNVGPMAQTMERNPVAATAVKTDPQTGLKYIDKDKALKVTMSGVAAAQQQIDDLHRMLAARGGRQ